MKARWLEVEQKLFLIEAWARDGLNEAQIAKKLGIGISTFSKYKVEHIELIEALKSGKEVADVKIENVLYAQALAGNITAAIFWLKNRRPDKWREKNANIQVNNFNDLNLPITSNEMNIQENNDVQKLLDNIGYETKVVQ